MLIKRCASGERDRLKRPDRSKVYNPVVPELLPEGVWHLVAIERGQSGTQDPHPSRQQAVRPALISLRLPRFHQEKWYTFPPANTTHQARPSTSGESSTRNAASFITPPRPLVLSVPHTQKLPSSDKIFRTQGPSSSGSPYVPTPFKPGPSSAPTESHSACGTVDSSPPHQPVAIVSSRSGDDVLFLVAESSPVTFSPSLLSSSPPKRFRPSDSGPPFPRRNLHF